MKAFTVQHMYALESPRPGLVERGMTKLVKLEDLDVPHSPVDE